jgi:hypothetical protein
MSGEGRCIFCCARHFSTANSTPLISISRNLAPFDKLNSNAIIQKCLYQTTAPFHMWAPARSRIVDPAIWDIYWGWVNGIWATWLAHRKSRRLTSEAYLRRAGTPQLPEPVQASESPPHRRPTSRCVLGSQKGSIQHVDSSRNLTQRHRIDERGISWINSRHVRPSFTHLQTTFRCTIQQSKPK